MGNKCKIGEDQVKTNFLSYFSPIHLGSSQMQILNGKKISCGHSLKKLFREVYKVPSKIEHSLLITDYPNARPYPLLEIDENFRYKN